MALNNVQVLTLQLLDKAKGPLSRAQIEEKLGFSVSPEQLGPSKEDTITAGNGKYEDCLWAQKLVHTNETVEGGPTLWVITPKGSKQAKEFKARKPGAETKVPPAKLDPVLKKALKDRRYAFDVFSPEDWKEVRAALPNEFKSLDLEDLKNQALGRRKQGVFGDPVKKLAKFLKSALAGLGDSGWAIKGLLTPEQVKKIEKEIKNAKR